MRIACHSGICCHLGMCSCRVACLVTFAVLILCLRAHPAQLSQHAAASTNKEARVGSKSLACISA